MVAATTIARIDGTRSVTSAQQTAEDQGVTSNDGILPAEEIDALFAAGVVRAPAPLANAQVQPASMDLRLGATAYRVRASFLPGRTTRVEDRLADVTTHAIDLSQGAVLETGCVYVVPLLEELALPEGLAASTNPKSSTGRLDVFTRVITDGSGAFDMVSEGYSGPLYAEICPQTFPIVVRTGSRLSQIRFRRGEVASSDEELAALHAREPLIDAADHPDINGGIAVSVDLAGNADGLVGYRAKRHTGVVDVDRPASCRIDAYWEPVRADERRALILDPDQFYILASKEAVRVPPSHAAEMVPFNPLVGEFRVHYAGFFDPGFGHAAAGGNGSRAVLEVRSHAVPFILEDGQVIGRLVYEKMAQAPQTLYGAGLSSNYQGQGLKLSKHFIP
ncbi:MAG: 2'-deoxycytidine 5'-triphosphate deaminase [Pseudomonadota bacterium]